MTKQELQHWTESDGCPLHGKPIYKTYTFGKYGDASVTTFKGCRCAVCVNEASLQCGVPLGHEISHHGSYAEASGRARLIVMKENADNAAISSRG